MPAGKDKAIAAWQQQKEQLSVTQGPTDRSDIAKRFGGHVQIERSEIGGKRANLKSCAGRLEWTSQNNPDKLRLVIVFL